MYRSAIVIVSLLAAGFTAPLHAEVPLYDGGETTIAFEGLLQADGYWFDSDVADLGGSSETGLRRAELVLKGKAPGTLSWVVGYDAHAEKWLDVNLRRPFGPHTLQAGQYKQPNSLEELSSTKNNDFISKAAVTNTFAVSRRLGAGYTYAGDDWSISASAFGRELTDGGARGSGHALRATFAPIASERHVLHLGGSWASFDTDADSLRLRARPQADLAAVRLLDTGTFTDADRVGIAGLEGLYLAGPLKLQSEWMHAHVERHDPVAGFDAEGGYLSAVYNLGGQDWGYKAGVPTTPAAGPGGGLWQAGLRLDVLDLDDGAERGGRMQSLTAGVNWYWTAHFKLMLDYVAVRSERRGIDDDPHILEARMQLAW